MKADYPSLDEQAKLARELAGDAMAYLECQDRRLVNSLSLQIGRAMFQYVGLKAAREQWKPTKQQKQVLARLHRQLLDVRVSLGELNPEYRRAIGNLVGSSGKKNAVSLTDVDTQLADVAATTDLVLRFLKPPPGPPRNRGLEAAVRRLMPIFERLSGEAARIAWNKPTGDPAEPATRSSAVLVRTLRRFPSPPSQTAILNMVNRVQHNPESEVFDVEVEVLRSFTEAATTSLPR